VFELPEEILSTIRLSNDVDTREEAKEEPKPITGPKDEENSSEDEDESSQVLPRGALAWLKTSVLPDHSLGLYKAIFTNKEQEAGILDQLRQKQLSKASPSSQSLESHLFLCMTGGGHFAAMIVEMRPKPGKILLHKTFHRYTTRRKQGGAQSSNDAAKGAAHSAGSSLRRYNEAALSQEVRDLLKEWKSLIDSSELLFVRATGPSNRRALFGPYDGQILRQNDPRLRGFPFSTKRATQAELVSAFNQLTRLKVAEIDHAAIAAAAEAAKKPVVESPKPAPKPIIKLTEEEEAALHHTTQIQALIRRSRVPALLQYLTKNRIPADFVFEPHTTQQNHHASRPLHLAASLNNPLMIAALLTRSSADPTLPNAENKTAFEICGDRQTRDAFRVARQELGEDRWDWTAARVPSGISKVEAEEREHKDKTDADIAEATRRKLEVIKLREETEADNGNTKKLQMATKSGAALREEQGMGMTPEMRQKLERERRARAAEARMKANA
jgi:hypothetical protein